MAGRSKKRPANGARHRKARGRKDRARPGVKRTPARSLSIFVPGVDQLEPRPAKMPGARTAFRSPLHGFVAVADEARRAYHQEQRCPACVPEGVDPAMFRWPVPCPCRVTPNVVCGKTAAVEDANYAHHWDCPFWDHYPEEVPF